MELAGVSERRHVQSGTVARSNADAVDIEALVQHCKSDYVEGDGRGREPRFHPQRRGTAPFVWKHMYTK